MKWFYCIGYLKFYWIMILNIVHITSIEVCHKPFYSSVKENNLVKYGYNITPPMNYLGEYLIGS